MTEKKKCCAIICRNSWPHACSKSGSHEYEGKFYCATHNPVKERERRQVLGDKWQEKFQAELEAERQEKFQAELEAERLKHEAQKALERDAARYRWLRSAPWVNDDKMHDAIMSGMDAMDAAIDAAMKETP